MNVRTSICLHPVLIALSSALLFASATAAELPLEVQWEALDKADHRLSEGCRGAKGKAFTGRLVAKIPGAAFKALHPDDGFLTVNNEPTFVKRRLDQQELWLAKRQIPVRQFHLVWCQFNDWEHVVMAASYVVGDKICTAIDDEAEACNSIGEREGAQ